MRPTTPAVVFVASLLLAVAARAGGGGGESEPASPAAPDLGTADGDSAAAGTAASGGATTAQSWWPRWRWHRESRIIGGTPVTSDAYHRYSFAVGLSDRVGLFCGGSLVARDVVLTAAHCWGPPGDVVIGRRDLMSREGEVIGMREQVKHPHYDEWRTDNDVMLVFLERPTNQDVQLATLNRDPAAPAIGATATVVGWGDTDRRDEVDLFSAVLVEVDVQALSNQECEASTDGVNSYRGHVTPNMLCAEADLKDSCQGDSGGPLFLLEDGAAVQVGVVSWGIGCASEHFPGVYARVSRTYDWIEEAVCAGSAHAAAAGFDCDRPPPSPRPTPLPTPPPTPFPTTRPTFARGLVPPSEGPCNGIENGKQCRKLRDQCKWKKGQCHSKASQRKQSPVPPKPAECESITNKKICKAQTGCRWVKGDCLEDSTPHAPVLQSWSMQ